jgi:hypothetical protein
MESREGDKEHGKLRQQNPHLGLDHNINSLCASASDFERLLEFSFTTKKHSGSTPKHRSSMKNRGAFQPAPHLLFLFSFLPPTAL